MVAASQYARQVMSRWLNTINDGDYIKFRHGTAILYNSGGMELDSVRLMQQK